MRNQARSGGECVVHRRIASHRGLTVASQLNELPAPLADETPAPAGGMVDRVGARMANPDGR